MTSRHQLEAAWAKAKQPVAQNQEPTVIFDRQRRINLLWDLFFAALFLLLLAALIAGVR